MEVSQITLRGLKGDIADAAEEFHLMNNNLKDIVYIIFKALPDFPGRDVLTIAADKFFGP